MDSHSLLQGIFLTQGLNPGLLHCRQFLYLLSQQEKHKVIMICKKLNQISKELKKKNNFYLIWNSKSRVQWNSGKFPWTNLLRRIYTYIPVSTLKMWKKQTSHAILYNPLEKFLPDCLSGCPILQLSTAIWFFTFLFFCCQVCLCLNHSPWEMKTPENKDWRESWDMPSYLNTS